MKKLLSVFVMMLVAAMALQAAEVGPATGQAKAKIIAPISITHHDGSILNFGAWVSPEAAGTVVVPAEASPSASPSSGLVAAAGDPVTSDMFDLTGLEAGETYNVVFPQASVTIANANSDTMTVDTFTHSSLAAAPNEMYVGGTLHIGAHQASGVYTGSYQVKITY